MWQLPTSYLEVEYTWNGLMMFHTYYRISSHLINYVYTQHYMNIFFILFKLHTNLQGAQQQGAPQTVMAPGEAVFKFWRQGRALCFHSNEMQAGSKPEAAPIERLTPALKLKLPIN